MPSNVEIKAKVSDPAQFARKAAELSQSEGRIIRQHDTFFTCSRGRLKLRDFMVPTERLSGLNESGDELRVEKCLTLVFPLGRVGSADLLPASRHRRTEAVPLLHQLDQ